MQSILSINRRLFQQYLLSYKIIIISIFLLSILCSCNKNSENSVVEPESGTPIGTWCATRIDGSLDPNGNPLVVTCDVSTWVFNSDGTYTWFLHAPPYYNVDDTGTYTYENERITLNGAVSQLPVDGYIEFPEGSTSFTFLDDDDDRWVYELSE